jgi:hypothetical protein
MLLDDLLGKKGGFRMSELLEAELKTYEVSRDQLLGSDSGKFVLIKEDRVVGTFDTKPDAIRAGYEQFGNVPFLVKQIVQVEAPLNFTSNLLGV